MTILGSDLRRCAPSPTWIVFTTPLAMTESFPATERTPSLSWDMSGALGSMSVRRYAFPVCTRQKEISRQADNVKLYVKKLNWREKTQGKFLQLKVWHVEEKKHL